MNPCFLLDEVEYTIERQVAPPSHRNLEIYRRYIAGERAIDLAAEYSVSGQRIYQIVDQVDAYMGWLSSRARKEHQDHLLKFH